MALPKYFISILDPPMVCLLEMHRIICNFFWNDNLEGKRCHWVSWKKLCIPLDEGGLGLRQIYEMLEAFNLKQWWRFREKNFLWSNYLMNRCVRGHPCSVLLATNASSVRKRMWRIREKVENKMRWLIGRGEIDIGYDTWFDGSLTTMSHGPVHSLFLYNRNRYTVFICFDWLCK